MGLILLLQDNFKKLLKAGWTTARQFHRDCNGADFTVAIKFQKAVET